MKPFAYIPHPDFKTQLKDELIANQALFIKQSEDFYLLVKDVHPLWAQQVWANCEIVDIDSISDAQKKLKARGGFWIAHTYEFHRRTQLIAEKIPRFRQDKLIFPLPSSPTGTAKQVNGFCLLEENKMLISQEVYPPMAGGCAVFDEDKNAPSRAYQKLWEAFRFHVDPPLATDRVLELGSSPGGWTYVLAGIGCKVISVDTAELDESVLKFTNVEYLQKDAFKIKPDEIGAVDWLFSDIICDPKRLLYLVNQWRDSKKVKNFLCTIKLKDDSELETLRKFQAIANSKIVHLSCNKHELTWILKKK